MSWRIVEVQNRAKLDYRLGYMEIRKEKPLRIHLSEISMLIIESTEVSITAALLNELAKAKVKVVFCDEKRNPAFEMMSYYGSHDSTEKIRTQIQWSDAVKGQVWTSIVYEKIKKQAETLDALHLTGSELLYSYLEEMEFGDRTNREGLAAKSYFSSLFGSNFSRSYDIDINKCLNYGYSILLSAFNREVVSNGYLTQLGLFHDNMFNHFNLSCDLMEPFRPIVDQFVYRLAPSKFESEEKLALVNLMNQEIIIGEKRQTINNAIKIYSKSVFDAINERDTSLLRFYRNEL